MLCNNIIGLFQKLPALKILDLRKNKLDHMEGPLVLNKTNFQAMYLSGNLWNCTRNMKWLLGFDEGQKVLCINSSLSIS